MPKILKIFFLFCACAILTFVCVVFRGSWSAPDAVFASGERIILITRLLQALAAFSVGSALAVSGVGCQAVLRNDLAEPYLLGVSGGAGCGAALTIVLGLASRPLLLPLGAFAGAAAALALVLGLARGAASSQENSSGGILLGGVIVGSVASSILMFMVSIMNQHELNSVTWWLLGSLQFCESRILYWVLAISAAGTLALFALGREVNAIAMGDEMAHDFGVSSAKCGVAVLLIAAFLAASSVALAGIIGFVGLIVPHILRRLFGADHRILFPAAFLFGGLFLVWCDLLAQSVYSEQELPVGVVTSLLGGPFFLWLLYRARNRRSA